MQFLPASRLDELLPAERSASGAPSTADFLLHEIPTLIDMLAVTTTKITLAVEGVPGVRVLIAAGFLVPYVALSAVLASDGAIEIIYLEIDELLQTSAVPSARFGHSIARVTTSTTAPRAEQSHHIPVRRWPPDATD